MAPGTLNGIKVAIVLSGGFEQVEMREPRKPLDAVGATTRLLSPSASQPSRQRAAP